MRRLSLISMLIAISMCIFIIESALPPLTPFPGVKLGLSNVIILITMLLLDKKAAAKVLIIKIILSAVIAGQGISVVYSLSGGILAFLTMSLLSKPLKNYIWVISTLGACAHNAGQILAAVAFTGTTAVIAYFPILIISGIITGAVTGIICQAVIIKSVHINKLFSDVRSGHK